jgi:anaerobic C4-dicarboxylate transporter
VVKEIMKKKKSFLARKNVFAMEKKKKENIKRAWFFGTIALLAICIIVILVVMREIGQLLSDIPIVVFSSIASVLFLITMFYLIWIVKINLEQDDIYNERKIEEQIRAQQFLKDKELKQKRKQQEAIERATTVDYSALGEEYAKFNPVKEEVKPLEALEEINGVVENVDQLSDEEVKESFVTEPGREIPEVGEVIQSDTEEIVEEKKEETKEN